MANYAVTDVVIAPGNLTEVAAAIETAIELVDTTKAIQLMNIFFNTVTGQYEGVIIHVA